MKRLYSIALAAVLLVALSGCGMEPVGSLSDGSDEDSFPESSASESVPAADSAPESSEESSGSEPSAEESPLPGELSPDRVWDWTYDAVILASYESHYIPSAPPRGGSRPFYTMHTDEGWGLMDENGREILSCMGLEPLGLCPVGHWMSNRAEEMDWEEHDQLSAKLEELTGFPLCTAHGGGSVELIWESTVGIPQRFFHMEGGNGVYPIEEADTLGDLFFPVHLNALRREFEDEMPYTDAQSPWNFSDREGNLLLPGEEFDQVGWFCGEALAPVQKDGKWAYVDAQGNFATGFLYDSAWGSDYFWMPDEDAWQEVSPCYAYGMWGGAAMVCREGKWGVLDGTGKEAIPCAYEAGAPYPGGAILKKDGQWGLYLLDNEN